MYISFNLIYNVTFNARVRIVLRLACCRPVAACISFMYEAKLTPAFPLRVHSVIEGGGAERLQRHG